MYANRGKGLENLIELSNMRYRKGMVADIHKVATPVKILKNERGIITGYLEKKSTVDYEGIANFGVRPIPIVFDAKETKGKSLPFGNIADHQKNFLQDRIRLGSEAFIVVHFTEIDRYFRLSAKDLLGYMKSPWPGNLKSIPLKYFEDYAYEIKREKNEALDYLAQII